MYTQIKNWKSHYAKDGMPDNRSVQDFVTCETEENIKSLQNELIGISKGKYAEEALNAAVGQKRVLRYGSYDEWAKLMLQWLVIARR